MAIALAAPHPEAIAAGERAVAAGGTAVDAALAAAVMLTVVYPHQCALGGDLIALVRSPEGETTAVVAAGTAPSAIADAAAATWTEVPRQGAGSVTVPGMVAGWRAIAARGAQLGLASAFVDAAAVAEAGFPVSAGLARALVSRADAVQADAGMRGVFTRDGAALTEGEILTQPALAETLRTLSVDPDDFYHGGIARALVGALQGAGGTHTLDDFAGYVPEVGDAVSRAVGDQTWHVAPPPSVGPVLIGVVAAAQQAPAGAERSAQRVAAAVRGVRARAAVLGDPRRRPVDLEALLRLDDDASAPPFTEPRPLGDTAAVTAIDDDGWGVTIVQSVYQTFGAGLLDARTGIVFHNRGSAFSIDPGSPAAIGPGIRPPHTLSPAIVDAPGVTVVAGCQGGRAQAWILAQVLPDATLSSQDLDEVLARPRWVVGDRDLGQPELSLVTEPGVDTAAVASAQQLGLPIVRFAGPADEAGHVQVVRRAEGRLSAASDPRADGTGIVVATPTTTPTSPSVPDGSSA